MENNNLIFSFGKNVRYRHEKNGAIITNGCTWSEVNIEGANCLDLINKNLSISEIIDQSRYNLTAIQNFINELIIRKIVIQSLQEEKFRNCRIGLDRIRLNSLTNKHSLIAPIKLGIEITGLCNYHCQYCSADMYDKTALEFETIKKIYQKCKENGVFSISLSGGEPFIHPQIIEIISLFANSDSPKLLPITSNGSIFLQNKIENLKDIGVKRMQISMLSMDSQKYMQLSGGQKQETVLKTIELLKLSGIEVILCHTATLNGFNEIREIANFCKNNEIKKLHLMTLMSVGRASSQNWKFTIKDYLTFYKVVCDVQEEFSNDIIIDFDPMFLPTVRNDKMHKDIIGCRAGQYELYILPNGTILPCNVLSSWPSYVCGNIYRNDFIEIWRNSDDLKHFRNRRISKIKGELCNGCNYYNDCRGGCPAEDEISDSIGEHRCYITDLNTSSELAELSNEIRLKGLFNSWLA